ncbi:MAG: Hsp70 family protein, partial [bacterium]|nr:Hsp70 family protein [bacterium]
YGLDMEDIHTILVWDLGGGTFDVSILELGEGVFEVKAVNGNTNLGGDDWDQRIMDYLAQQFKEKENIDLGNDRVALQKLKQASEKAKIELSKSYVAEIRIPFISDGKTLQAKLTRDKFNELTKDLLQKMVGPTKQALADAELKPREIDRVVLVGGSTRMPAVQELVRNLLGKEPYVKINPDEVVAIGAAIQAGILTGQVRDVVLIDVIPLSLGIETQGGIFSKIIERNTTIPTSAGHIFTTAHDNQTEVDIHVLQGERALAAGNISLGHFQLKDIPLARRGEPQIEVTFDIDQNGILNVSAHDLYTGNKKSVQIKSPGKLSDEEIKRMLEESQIYAEQDEKRKEEIQINIGVENMIRAAQVVMEDGKDILYQSELDEVERKILEVKGALTSGDSQKIKLKTDELKEKVKALDRKIKGYRRQNINDKLQISNDKLGF